VLHDFSWLALNAHTGKANGHKRVDVGAALHQVGGNTGSGKVGWIDDETLSTSNTGYRNV
jgi:hypothetical protein